MNTNQNEMEGNVSHLDIFNYENLGQVRTQVDDNGELWFCHKDICDILGITDQNVAIRRLSRDGVCSTPTLTNGGTQNMNFINEGNLMRLIFTSRKPEAKKFRSWVCQVVLPELRKKNMFDPSKCSRIDMLKLIINTMEKEKMV